MRSNSADQKKQVSAQLLAYLLAGVLIIVVVGLNLFDGGMTVIPYEQFQRLVEHGLVKRIAVADDHLEIRLERAVRVEGLRERPMTEFVQVELAGSPTVEDVEAWREGGVDIGDSGPSSQLGRSIFLGLVSVGLLAGGVWYLIAQARADRRRPGPRQRLRDAEAEHLAGRMTWEEYQKEADRISAEL